MRSPGVDLDSVEFAAARAGSSSSGSSDDVRAINLYPAVK
jgi:hypothetical protein